jgi:hypothetical protein
MDGNFRNQQLVKFLEFEECDDIADLAEALSPDSVSSTTVGQSVHSERATERLRRYHLLSLEQVCAKTMISLGTRIVSACSPRGDEGVFGINGYIERAFSEITFGFDDCD